jgi:hypothetical protein
MTHPRARQPQAERVACNRTRADRPGYVYLHSAVDGFSRPAYTKALPDERATTAIGFLHRARAFFAAHGIARIQCIVTGNGVGYRRPRVNRPKAARLVEMFADDGGLLVRGLQGG